MIFNSLEFIPFFVVVYSLYLCVRHRTWQNAVLLVASYVFYGYAAPAYVFLLAFYTLVGFFTGLAVERRQRPWRRWILSAAVVSNLGVLAYFKYADFFIEQVAAALAALGWSSPLQPLKVVLPIGVSFFAFQCIAYMVDVYRGDVRACRSFLDFAVFKAFFPQLVAGPIERARHMLPQFERTRRIDAGAIRDGLYFVLLGYVLKCVVADRVASLVDYQFTFVASVDRTPESVVRGMLAFGIQIYGDFAGYTYIALGLARLMGIELSRNFLAPYLATDIQEFWRRWHVTLSNWLRDYLYIPLGGSRHGEGRTLINLLVTMALGGLWHGASWNFVIWGVLHGAGLVAHRITKPLRERLPDGVRTYGGWLLTLVFVMFGWGIFRVHSMADLSAMLRALMSVDPVALVSDSQTWILVAILATVIGVQYAEERRSGSTWVSRLPLEGRVAVYVASLASVLAMGFGSHRFIYFQF